MDLISRMDLWLALGLTVVLIVAHYVSVFCVQRNWLKGRFISSLAGGAAVTFVFLHLLPDLVESNTQLGAFFKLYVHSSRVMDLCFFGLVLLAFIIYYGAEVWVAHWRSRDANQYGQYLISLVMFAIYNFVITYTIPLQLQVGTTYAVMFVIIIALHFICVDRHFSEHYAAYFNQSGKHILALALLVGWLFAYFFEPVNVMLVYALMAFLSGSVMFTAFRQELPAANHVNYSGFVVGAIFVGSLLIMLTMAKISL